MTKIDLEMFVGLAMGVLLTAMSVSAQSVIVDATPSHVVNTFSPPHALGGAIDRLRAGKALLAENQCQRQRNRSTRIRNRC